MLHYDLTFTSQPDRCYIQISAFVGESIAIGEPYNASNHRPPLDLVLQRIVILSRLIIHVVTHGDCCIVV
jgi:hypothetical protein